MANYQRVTQEFMPIIDEKSEILILGSLPSVKSRENGFYYGHPQNRFWKVLAAVLKTDVPSTIEEKKTFLLDHGIAVYDVILSCDIIGSSDSSVKNVVAADIAGLIKETAIKRIYVNGTLAKNLYDKFVVGTTGIEAVKLPSTSPANARYSLEKLVESWKIIR